MARRRLFLNAVFVLAVLGLAGFGAHQVARRHWQVQPTFRLRAHFETIGGLAVGHRVRLQGMDAGVVERIVPPAEPGQPVELVMRIDERLQRLIRTDAVARVVSEGLVGAKMVEIVPGRPDAPPVGTLGRIGSERPVEMADLIKKAAESLARIDAVALAAERELGDLKTITDGVRRGEGSLGKLVRDDAAYQSLLEVAHRGERTLQGLEDNLSALKETWPLSRYFDRRAFLDRERVLFQPGAERTSRSFRAEDLFAPGRAVLTRAGQVQLDEVARWVKQVSLSHSEVVIAAFTDDDRDRDLAEILTQEQAEAVRRYLVDKHSIQSAGWFKSRKIAAVGFGVHSPRTLEPAAINASARRIDIIVFTPQV
jgi:phospholipid/cholesterol/gamma-HCH transport system substrate-binding protein